MPPTRRSAADWTKPHPPDLTPADTRRRLKLIRAAQAATTRGEPAPRWTTRDIALVAGVEGQTIAAWAGRHPDFPTAVGETQAPQGKSRRTPRATYEYDSAAVIQWLIRTERLFPGSWLIAAPRTGRQAARPRPALQLPGALSRVLGLTLGLRKGEHFTIRSRVDDAGIRVYTLTASEGTVADAIAAKRTEVSYGAAEAGHPILITRVDDGPRFTITPAGVIGT